MGGFHQQARHSLGKGNPIFGSQCPRAVWVPACARTTTSESRTSPLPRSMSFPCKRESNFAGRIDHAPHGFPPIIEHYVTALHCSTLTPAPLPRWERGASSEIGLSSGFVNINNALGGRLIRGNDRRFLTAVHCLTPTASAAISNPPASRCGSGIKEASRRRVLRFSLYSSD